MKDKKRFLALVLSVLLLVPAPGVYASDMSGGEQAGDASGGNQEGEEPSGGQEGEGTEQPGNTQKEFTISEEGVLTAYTGQGGEITIPATVTEIDEKVFKDNETLTKVTCPEGLKTIGKSAFFGCVNLEEINFNPSLEIINESAFEGCSNLNQVICPDGLKSIEVRGAFRNCTSLKEVRFNASLESIGGFSFENCTSLTEITIPSSVTHVGDDAFCGCSALENLTFEPREEGKPGCALYGSFTDCTSLRTVELPSGIDILGRAFSGCSSLQEFKLAEGNTQYTVFDGCLYHVDTFNGSGDMTLIAFPAGKTEVTFPEKITKIGEEAFDKTQLASVEIPDTVTEIGSLAFNNCKNLEKCILPKNLKRIEDYTFRDCERLKEIDIPETVDYIGFQAFMGCKELKTATVPGSVKMVGVQAFYGCTKLGSIYFKEGVQSLGEDCFTYCPSLVTIAIPESVSNILYDSGIGTVGWKEEEDGYDRRKVTIYGKAGSAAEAHAKVRGVNFSTEEPPVPPEYDISSDMYTVTLDQDAYTYDGKAKRPIATVMKDGKELLRGTDFTVKYENNINPGTAKAIITGDGEYGGTIEKTFTIYGKDISGSGFTVTLSETTFTYDGKEKKPNVTVMEGTNKLAETSFTVKYENNVNPGKAKAIVAGAGAYTGTVTKEFTIEKKSLGLSGKTVFEKKYGDKAFSLKATVKKGGKITYSSSDKKVASVDQKGKVTIKGTGVAVITLKAKAAGYEDETLKVTVKVSPAKPAAPSLKTTSGRKLKVSWKMDKRATGYQIQCCTSNNFKKGVKSFSIGKNKTISKTIPKLVKGKQYYVRVRSYKSVKINKKPQKLYSPWSSVKRSGKIKK